MSLLGQLTENALTRYIEIENPDDDVPNTFVDGRNHLFLSFAAVLDKSETWELANKLGKYDYVREKTLTCYNGIKGSGCGECPSCKLRQAGLEKYLARRGKT